MDPNQDTSSDYTSISIDHKDTAPGDVQPSQVLPNETVSHEDGFDMSSLSRGNTAPRLSIQSGTELSSRETVELWRTWKLKTKSGRDCKPPDHFIIIASVEDTGATLLHFPKHRWLFVFIYFVLS